MTVARVLSCGWAFAVLAASCGGASAQTEPPGRVVAAAKLVPVIYSVTLNGQRVSDGALMLQDARGELYFGSQDLRDWHVAAPAGTPVSAEGAQYYPLRSLAGATAKLDASTLSVALTLPATMLERTVVALRRAGPPAAQIGRGAFVDYDLNAQRAGAFSLASATLDGGTFVGGGLAEAQVAAYSAGGRNYVRPEVASWSRDDLARHATLRLGDAYTSGGTFAQNLPFVGAQWGTNPVTQPLAVLQALPTFTGVAASPSVVQVYANGQLVASGSVPAGPFAIPASSGGTGFQNYTVVVTDAQGRRSISSAPGYIDASLLRACESTFSYSAGRAYTLPGTSAGTRLLAEAVQRRGITDHLTAELTASAGIEDVLGADLHWSPGRFGTFVAGAAYHRANGATDLLHDFGYSYVTPRFSLLARTRTTPNLVSGLTDTSLHASTDQETSVAASWRFGAHARAQVEYQSSRSAAFDATRSLAASWVRELRNGSFVVSATRQTGTAPITSVEIGMSRRLGRNESVYVAGGHGGTGTGSARTPTVQFDAPAPAGNGVGVSLGSDSRNGIPFSGRLEDRTPFADATLSHSREMDASLDELRVRGGFALVGRRLYATRWLDSGFALVQTGYAGLPVYANNVLVGRTDARGDAFVRDLAPYRANALSVDPSSLPLGVSLDTDASVVPAPRTGLRVRFATRSSGAVRLRLRLADGTFVPAGSTIAEIGGTLSSFAGSDGQVYLENVRPGKLRLRAGFGDDSCEAAIVVPADVSATPDLGTVSCK
jgi:outer membrane usher protein